MKMKVITKYHGEIEIDESQILTLEKGMLGYEYLTKFVLISEEDLFLEYLQSVEDQVAFAIMDPFMAKKDYAFELPDSVVKALDIKSESDVVIKTVVVIPEQIEKIRTNLQAPIIFNKENNKGMQIILGDEYPMRYEFFHKEDDKQC